MGGDHENHKMSSSDKSWKNRLRRARPEEIQKQLEANFETEKRRANEQAARADALYQSTRDIENVIRRLAEKWRPMEGNFWENIERLSRKYANDPEILSVRLVETLVKGYEQQWETSRVSEEWDSQLWKDLNKLVAKYHIDPTQMMRQYEEEMTTERAEGLKRMKAFVQRVEDQYESIKQLQNEIAILENKTLNAGSEQEMVIKTLEQSHEKAIQLLKQEHDDSIVQIITQAQEKLKEELAEQASQRRQALVEAQLVYSTEKGIMQKGYEKEMKDAEHRAELEKLALQTTLQEKLDLEIKTMRETHTKSVNSLITQNTSLQEKLDDATINLQKKVEKMKKELEDEIIRLKKELETRKTTFNEHLENVAKNHTSELKEIAERHETEKKDLRIALNREIHDLKFEISELKEAHIEQIRAVEQRDGLARKAIEDGHRETTTKMQRDFDEQTKRLKGRHSDREKELEAKITQLIKSHTLENTKLRTMITELETEHAQEKAELEQQVTSELTRLRSDFKAKKAQLESSHAEATSQLRNDVEAYSQALLARDDFKPMPDNEIKSKFEDLAEEVKTLGRLEWKEDQDIWPLQVLKRLSTNTTLLKRRILQEAIWIILHKFIFCSPFRAFGEEGEIMEKKWNDAFGTDAKFENGCYTWPQPEMEAERWRYVNVKECRTALRQPIDSEWDPRAKLKMGFRSALEDIRNEFVAVVGELVHLEKANIQLMDKITKKAANVWLEYGMQRCRIVILFPSSSLMPAEEKLRKIRDSSFDLVVVPELRRYGNSKGLELHTEATVAGCGGEIVEVSVRKS